ncbi:MAG TPA: hypothetical protein VHJ59_08120, partial [Nitrososphaera sp.]|nr:hypothetical protein [Nitrososphaera sp.]
MSYGFSDGTNDACQAQRTDESAEVESVTMRDDSVIAIIDLATNAIVSQADVSAFAAGSFTLNWSVQSDTTAMQIHYMVAGGTDITNVGVVSAAIGDINTGNHSYNGSGTTFTPDFALMMTGSENYNTVNVLNTSNDRSVICIGAAKSTTQRWVMWGRDETVGISDCDMYITSTRCLSECSSATGAIVGDGDFVSFDNAAGGGITVNITDAFTNAGNRLAFLLVKGGTWDCGTFQQRSGTGTQDVTIATGLDPELVFLGGINSATSGTVVANCYLGIGGSDGTNEGCSWTGCLNASSVFVTANTGLNTKVFRQATPLATPTSSTTDAECDMSDMATTGQFTLNWTTADTTQRQMAFWVLGPSAAAGNNVERGLSESVTVTETSLNRLSAKTRARSETVTITETAARLGTKLRPLATETITLTDNVVRLKAKNVSKTLADTITETESIARLKAAMRIQADTITLSETAAKMTAKTRIASDSITLSESIARIKGKLKVLAETTTLTESLARLASKSRAAADTITISETIARLVGKIRTASDLIT